MSQEKEKETVLVHKSCLTAQGWVPSVIPSSQLFTDSHVLPLADTCRLFWDHSSTKPPLKRQGWPVRVLWGKWKHFKQWCNQSDPRLLEMKRSCLVPSPFPALCCSQQGSSWLKDSSSLGATLLKLWPAEGEAGSAHWPLSWESPGPLENSTFSPVDQEKLSCSLQKQPWPKFLTHDSCSNFVSSCAVCVEFLFNIMCQMCFRLFSCRYY